MNLLLQPVYQQSCFVNLFSILFTDKSCLQPGFNRPKQYNGEMRFVCDLYLWYFFIYVFDWSVVCIKASAKMLVYGRLSIRCLNWHQMQNDLWSRTWDAQCVCSISEHLPRPGIRTNDLSALCPKVLTNRPLRWFADMKIKKRT